ncbi:hypothetical protein B0J17DRAFT_654075 [Rhizoctonia solani]|nr:hypothetical protein B0J17DRAFT_654075 [Rhizoctonia solani]
MLTIYIRHCRGEIWCIPLGNSYHPNKVRRYFGHSAPKVNLKRILQKQKYSGMLDAKTPMDQALQIVAYNRKSRDHVVSSGTSGSWGEIPVHRV